MSTPENTPHEGNPIDDGAEKPFTVSKFEVVTAGAENVRDPWDDAEELAREGALAIEAGQVDIDKPTD